MDTTTKIITAYLFVGVPWAIFCLWYGYKKYGKSKVFWDLLVGPVINAALWPLSMLLATRELINHKPD